MLSCYRYDFPFEKPFKTGAGELTSRKGLIFIFSVDGLQAYGEAAPLPGFSRTDLDSVETELRDNGPSIHDLFTGDINPARIDKRISEMDLSSELQFALSTVAHDYRARSQKVTLRQLLFDSSPKKIPVNITLSADNPERVLQHAERAWKQGFRTFKVKVGLNSGDELQVIHQVRETYPSSKIRIDANRSWTFDEAKYLLNKFGDYQIQYCEEPLMESDIQAFTELKNTVPVPLALDETVCLASDPKELIKKADVFIIKPMFLGNFAKNFETKRLLDSHDNTTVFTMALESGIGRKTTAILASGLGTKKIAHGLGTGSLLKMDVWYDRTYINNGYFHLPDGYGLGEKHKPKIQSLALDPIAF